METIYCWKIIDLFKFLWYNNDMPGILKPRLKVTGNPRGASGPAGSVFNSGDAVIDNFATFGDISGDNIKDSGLSLSKSGTLSENSDTKIPSQKAVQTKITAQKDVSETLTNKILTSPIINTGISGTAISTDGTLAENSDNKIPSQKAVRTYVDGKTIYINVKDYGAMGDGVTDDYQAIRNTINALPSTGGTIIFPVPSFFYKINSTIVVDRPVIFQGAAPIEGMWPDVPLTAMRGIKIKWGGGANPMFSVARKNGVHWTNLILDGNFTATYGLYLDRLKSGGCDHLAITGCITSAITFDCTNNVSGDNNYFNTFNDLHIEAGSGRGIEMISDYPTIQNTCHNTFNKISMDYEGDYGIYMNAADNNTFIGLYFLTAGSGKAVYHGGYTVANIFIHIQAIGGVLIDNAPGNWNGCIMLGYDRTNGEPLPTITDGAHITWMETTPYAYGWTIDATLNVGQMNVGGYNKVFGIAEIYTIDTNPPVGGGILWVQGGNLYYRGPDGTTTKLADG